MHFYTNDGDCVCVNARSGTSECWAELETEGENVVSATIRRTPLRACLPSAYLNKFKKVLGACPIGIYNKWKRFFLQLETVECEEFDCRITGPEKIEIIDETITDTPDSPIVTVKSATIRDEARGIFTFTDGRISSVDFKPFFESTEHPAVRKCYEDDGLTRWILESNFWRTYGWDTLGWPDYLISFSLYDLYEGVVH